MKVLNFIALAFVILGAFNWGLHGCIPGYHLASLLGSHMDIVGRIIYILIGFSGLYSISFFWKINKDEKPSEEQVEE